MSYSNILVAVAVTPESQQLLAKAVSIARPVKGHISLITLASDPEMYNQLAAPMLEDLRSVMQEESKRLARTVLIFTERSDQLSRATDRVPGLPANPGYAQ